MKTFKYIDGQGNVIGPATLASLQGLHKAGVIGNTTQVIDEESNRCLTVVQLLTEHCQGSGNDPLVAALPRQLTQAVVSVPLPPPPRAADANQAGRKSGIPKIGKRGWGGVVILVLGMGTFIGANKSAEDLIQTTWTTSGSGRVFADETLAKGAGYNSYSEYLAGQNRQSGAILSAIGLGLVIWGYTKYNSKEASL